MYGLFQLVINSKNKEAIKFNDVILNKIYPFLMEKNIFYKNSILSLINFDTCFIMEIDNIDQYDGYNVVYMIVIGIYNGGLLIKYGYTGNLKKRLEYHRNTYKPQNSEEGCNSSIKLVYVAKTNNNRDCENVFKQLVKSKNINVEIEFEGENKVELFTTNNTFTLEKAKEEMTRIITNRKSKIDQEKDEYIKELEEKNKQIEIKCNTDIVIKKIECEKEAKNAEENKPSMQIKLENKQVNKEVNKEDHKISINKKSNDLYEKYLDECTEENQYGHIHCSILYANFKQWFTRNNPNCKIPSNKDFCNNTKIHKKIVKVWIEGRSQLGIRNLKIK
jgi:hypothetical protein